MQVGEAIGRYRNDGNRLVERQIGRLMIRRVVDTFVLASSLQALKASKLESARAKLDQVLARSGHHFDFIVAFDAFVMVVEDRPNEAKMRFKECLESLPARRTADEDYIALYCEFFLSAYSGSTELDAIRTSAMDLQPRKTLVRFLKFPLSEVVEDFRSRILQVS